MQLIGLTSLTSLMTDFTKERQNMKPERTSHNCHSCKFTRSIPGDVHVSCDKAFVTEGNSMASVFQILGSVGRAPLPGPTEPVNFRPKTVSWPGCYHKSY